MEDQSTLLNAAFVKLGVLSEEFVTSLSKEPTSAQPAPAREKPPASETKQNKPRQERRPSSSPEGPTEPLGEYDPTPLIERLNVWWLNGKDRFFKIREEPFPVLSWGEKDLKRELRLAGVFSRSMEGKSYSQCDLVLSSIQDNRAVDYAGPIAGKRIGVYGVQGRKILVTSSFNLIEPAPGGWPNLRAVIEGMLQTPEADQTPVLYSWLKTGVEALRKSESRPGHALILAGPSDCGKSFIQEHVITPLFGGRSEVDPVFRPEMAEVKL